MICRIINLNCRDKEYQFNMSQITDQDWENFAHDVVLAKGKNFKDLILNGFKVVIRDNKAKFKLFYQDGAYHEVEHHLDEFGRVSKNYADIVSQIWQDVMEKYYGEEYQTALDVKLSTNLEQNI